MKKLCIAFIIGAALYGCHGPASTEINRPTPDVNNTRQLILKTLPEDEGEETFASASYSNGTATGFGPGVLITCNSFTIVDTRNGISANDTGRIIDGQPEGIFEWAYSDPDTSFVFDMPSHSGLTIVNDSGFEEISISDSLRVVYEPAGPCSNVQVILTDDESSAPILPVTRFNSSTGAIAPIPLISLGLQEETDGTITVAVLNDTIFSNPWIHSIIVEDSAVSQPEEVLWLP